MTLEQEIIHKMSILLNDYGYNRLDLTDLVNQAMETLQ